MRLRALSGPTMAMFSLMHATARATRTGRSPAIGEGGAGSGRLA